MKPSLYAKPYQPTIPDLPAPPVKVTPGPGEADALPPAPIAAQPPEEPLFADLPAKEESSALGESPQTSGESTTPASPAYEEIAETPEVEPEPAPAVQPPKGIPLSSPPACDNPAPAAPRSLPVPSSFPVPPAPARAPRSAPSRPVVVHPTPKPQPAPRPKAKPAPAKPDTDGSRRVLIVGRVAAAIITVAMLGIIARVYQLQTNPAPQLAALINAKYSSQELLGRRAPLLDRQGRLLAVTGIAHRLYVDPRHITDLSSFPERLGYTMGYDPASVARRLNLLQNKRYIVIDQKLNDEQWFKLEQFHLAGMYTDVWLDRHYPQGAVAGHVTGFVGKEGKGFEGAERMYDQQLAGKPGSMTYLRDAGRRPMEIDADRYRHATDGQAIRLSIDITLQSIAETELAAQCQQFGARTGELIVMDPHTGEILAMANYPTFDPNESATTPADIRRNRCVTDPFEPGSTFKPFVWAMAVEAGIAKPAEMINTNAPLGRKLKDTHDHGTISWEQVLVKSSNRGMALVGVRMGVARLHKAVKAFGFGDMTRSNLPGESKGLVKAKREWNPVYSVTSVPMGQEVAVTPLQLARAFCVFANDGLLPTPTLRARDLSQPGEAHNVTVLERVISPRTAQITRDTLRLAVTTGTGSKANSKVYEIFGKTGTAQVASRTGRGYEEGAYSSVFVASAPYDNPKLVIACVIHKPDPKKGYYGGIVAAPAVMRVFERSLPYLGVAPKVAAEPLR